MCLLMDFCVTPTVSENALIGSAADFSEPLPGLCILPAPLFQSLRQLAVDTDGAYGLLTLVVQKRRELIRVGHFVGLLRLPNGLQLDILPGITTAQNPRLVLLAMLRHLKNSPFKRLSSAATQAVQLPLWDVFVRAFLAELEQLVRQGVQQAYVPTEANERFWKGTFQAARHQRENAWQAARVAVRYDKRTTDIAPNRLLKTTLLFVQSRTADPASRLRIGQLLQTFGNVPVSASVARDRLTIDRLSRLFRHYGPALRWTQALLDGRAFGVQKGTDTVNLSLLFPVARVFEEYVAHGILSGWPDTGHVTVQESSAHLVDAHGGAPKFKLRPDIIIRQGSRTLVMDTKWKFVNGQESGNGNYGIEQADLYQLYAYGKKYAADDLFLIYPANETFREPLAVFGYDATTRLHVVPFDPANPLPHEVEKLARYALSC